MDRREDRVTYPLYMRDYYDLINTMEDLLYHYDTCKESVFEIAPLQKYEQFVLDGLVLLDYLGHFNIEESYLSYLWNSVMSRVRYLAVKLHESPEYSTIREYLHESHILGDLS